ncbi:MAG: NAD(+) diphosphatase [Acidobacteria bacterium]|nr:NAD(+) diphosphatase [Acidobacteriota bacterium]
MDERHPCLILRGRDLLLVRDGVDNTPRPPTAADLDALGLRSAVTRWYGLCARGLTCYAGEVAAPDTPPAPALWLGLRDTFHLPPPALFWAAGQARHLLDWLAETRFCGRCGGENRPAEGEMARQCPACGHLAYPRLSPAVIVAVVRDGRLLLARARHFRLGLHSVLAGYVEPGESLEETVHREIREEAGITVRDVSYFGSQYWPFSGALMVGFTAAHASGELVLGDAELVEAGWYGPDDLPPVPKPPSLSRQLIDWFTVQYSLGK